MSFTAAIKLRSATLPTLLAREGIDPARYDAPRMDTQGAELLVLKGAVPLLARFKFIKTEVPDLEAYAGCAQLPDIEAFVTGRGYVECSRHRFASRAAGGHYYDVVYSRTENRSSNWGGDTSLVRAL